MSSIRDFIYLESAFRCVNCNGPLKKYRDELGNIYYVCNSCRKKYFATKKPKTRYLLDISVAVVIILFFMSLNTDKYSLADYIGAWLIVVGFAAFVIISSTFINHYIFDEINLIEDTKKKTKGKFTGSLADFLLRRHQTLCPVCTCRHALINKKGKDGKIYYQCLACNQLFVENDKFNIFSVSYLLLMGIGFFVITRFIKNLWLLVILL
ncbi:MAG: hypothetical protein ACOX1F_06490 [Erysipelotrichaceae bacterium]|jgi:hypothetical protein